jgi:hypothetical protein
MSEKVADSGWVLGRRRNLAGGCDFVPREGAEYGRDIRFLGSEGILDGHR